MVTLDHITRQPDMMGGKACIRGMCVTVGMIGGLKELETEFLFNILNHDRVVRQIIATGNSSIC